MGQGNKDWVQKKGRTVNVLPSFVEFASDYWSPPISKSISLGWSRPSADGATASAARKYFTHIDAFLTASAHNYSDKLAERNQFYVK